jgi:hypothetical protein
MSNSGIIYRGPSLIDGQPIVVVATYSKSNRKTGTMVQTYILVDGMKPTDASKCGADYSICGNCPHRGIATDDPTKKQAIKRSCYVVLGQGPTIIHKSVERGVYPTVEGHQAIAAIGRGRMVRLGTYGDPAAVPSYIWESLISEAVGHTAYSHQSDCATADTRPDMYMTSADNVDQAHAAWSRGERTFRVVASQNDLVRGKEIICPASKEAGQRVSCVDCKLCVGSSIAAKSIAIVAHGAGATHFATQSLR